MRILILAGLCAATAFAFPGYVTTLELRLNKPLTSYGSETGSKFEAAVIAAGMVGNRILLPVGSIVYGTVLDNKTVGIGVVRERASLDLSFDRYRLPDGREFPMQGRLRTIENAREATKPDGQVEGILAANTPQGMLGAIWHSPNAELFQHSFIGIAGVSGRISSAYAMGPFGALALFAVRCIAFHLPEPEIRLPAGTEFKVALTRLPANVPIFDVPAPSPLSDDVADWLGAQPFTISKVNGHLTEDIINTGFLGSRDELLNAFKAAGWVEADPRSSHSVSHLWQSYTGQTGYPEAPASRLTYKGAEPDYVFQKSFNSIARRHHIRIWRADDSGRDLWVGAATHDIEISFHAKQMAFTHKIDPRIDVERTKVATDLAFVGCSDSWPAFIARPTAMRSPEPGKTVISDGRMAVITLRQCSGKPAVTEPLDPMPERSVFTRVARRVILDARQYLLRDNPYYWTYRAFVFHRARTIDPATAEY